MAKPAKKDPYAKYIEETAGIGKEGQRRRKKESDYLPGLNSLK